jgi:hypothetical protein
MRIRILAAVVGLCVAASLGAVTLASGHSKPPRADRGQKQAAKRENRALFAVLIGRNEIGTNGRRGAGDPDGRGSFTATVDGNQLCFGITVKNLDTPIAAHIHQGRRNVNGAIVVPLTAPGTGDPGAAGGCVTVDPTLAQAILKNPHKYYFNVHTAAFPNGAVRGQLTGKQR